MRELVKQRKYLTGLGRAVVDVDDWEHVIVEAEAGIPFDAERVLEHEHADIGERITPRFESGLVVGPRVLISQRHADVIANPRGHDIDANIIAETKIAGDQTWCRVAVLAKLREVELKGFALALQKTDLARREAAQLRVG